MLTPVSKPSPNANPSEHWPIGAPLFPSDEAGLRALIVHVARSMHQSRYVSSTAGSISARLDSERMLITPAQVAKSLLQPDQLLIVSLNGAKTGTQTEAARTLRLEDSYALHVACYRERPDVHGVVYAQPPIAVALTMAGVSLRVCLLPEAVVVLGLVPTAAYASPDSAALDHAVSVLIAQHDAILLAASGSITVGADAWQAYLRLETLEHTASIIHYARQHGPLAPLTPEQVSDLLQVRRALGYWREGDAERFCEACGAC